MTNVLIKPKTKKIEKTWTKKPVYDEIALACIIHEEKTKQKNKQLASKLIWKEMERKKIANMTNKTLKNELKKLKLCCVDIVIL